MVDVATLPFSCSFAAFAKQWERSRAVILRGPRKRTRAAVRASQPPAHADTTFDALRPVLHAHCDHLEESFTAENGSIPSPRPALKRQRGFRTCAPPAAAAELVSAEAMPLGSWYCSWIAQHRELLDRLLPALPCAAPPCLDDCQAHHESALWWFVGRNQSTCDSLPGRPEHTDEVVHDGTWHYQLEGQKEWTIRPTDELLERCGRGRWRANDGPAATTTVRCDAGDILLISTRDWWHATSIPPLGGRLSVSYAREFSLRTLSGAASHAGGGTMGALHQSRADEDDGMPTIFTNVDGLFATDAVAAGAVVMTEADPGMADAELTLSADPNCEVVEDEESGLQCLIALRDIRSGEFLTIAAESDDE